MDDYDGLTLEQALRLCVLRSGDLSNSQVKWIQTLVKKGEVKPEHRSRLAHIVARLRQGSLLAEAVNDSREVQP